MVAGTHDRVHTGVRIFRVRSRACSADDAAKFLGTSKKTVLRAFHEGHIKGYRLSLARKSPVVLYTASVESFDRRRKERQAAPAESNGA